MAPRGLSAEEKRVRLLEIFHETVREPNISCQYEETMGLSAIKKDFYQLKELEKLGPKMKGIVSQSVKEVLQSLVDDGLVQGDKIGSSNFFWSFPSQQGAMIQARLATVKELRDSQQKQLAEIRESIKIEQAARPESESRFDSLAKLASLRKQIVTLEKELAAHGDCDPVKIEEKKRAVFLAKEAALRWTDNYGALLAYFTRQHGVDPAEIRKFLEIDEDYEDIT